MAFFIVDKLTKLVKLYPMRKTDGAKETARLLMQNWVYTGKGTPRTIVSDRDTRFTSTLWKSMLEQIQVKTMMPTARHQQTNGQAEHAVKMAKSCLRALADYKGRNWATILPSIEYALNNAISSATGYTPFHFAYGFNPGTSMPTADLDLDKAIREKIDEARLRLARYQDRMEVEANKKRSTAQAIGIGIRVLLKREGINWPATSQSDRKLLSKYIGPFKVKAKDELGNVQIELPAALRVHD